MTVKAVLFDLDGTLVDSNEFHVKAWREAFSEAGLQCDAKSIHEQIGKGADMLVPALAPSASQSKQKRLGEAQGVVFKRKYLREVKPFAGARDLLLHVHDAGQAVVLASSASKEELDYYIGLLDVHDIVAETTSADDVKRTKPAPDIVAVALKRVAPLSAEEVIMIGDTPYDVEAAAKCAIKTIAVRSGGFSAGLLSGAGAIAIYNDVASLLAEYATSPLAL